MSTVVGLVKSRLRSRSRREKSIDGVDVVVDNGNGLVRYRSLRQEALADPAMDETCVLDPITAQPRTPNGIDPASLADGLEGMSMVETVPPVPALPADISSDSFPTRQSSLNNKTQYAIQAHRRASSHTKDDSLRLDALPEYPPRRRHYTISSTDERDQFETGDYFQTMWQESTQVGSPSQISPDLGVDAAEKPLTRTAKLFGTIAERRRSTEKEHEHGRHLPQGATHTPSDKSGTARPFTGESVDSYRPRARTSQWPLSPMCDDVAKPAPLQLTRTNKSNSLDHVRLPPGFELVKGQQTAVDTVWHPAVEQDIVHHDKTEIVHPMIEKDVHVHHYFQYEQPVAVTEVLPMKHYQLNPTTGEKIEIDPPPGWQPPQSISTTMPDTSQLKDTQGQYVVDSHHPTGKLEDGTLPEQQAVTTWI